MGEEEAEGSQNDAHHLPPCPPFPVRGMDRTPMDVPEPIAEVTDMAETHRAIKHVCRSKDRAAQQEQLQSVFRFLNTFHVIQVAPCCSNAIIPHVF